VLQLCAALALLNTLRFRFIPRAAHEAGTAARQRTLQNSLCTMQSIDTGQRKNLMNAPPHRMARGMKGVMKADM
jgi:hypothetical protein